MSPVSCGEDSAGERRMVPVGGRSDPWGFSLGNPRWLARERPQVMRGGIRMNIEMWPIDKPVPYARNARTLSARAVDIVAASIKEFGFRQPIVCDGNNVVVAGHTRLAAAKKLGLTEVPVHVALNLTAAQIKAYRLMDNRSNEESGWDLELLPLEFAELKEFNFDLSLTGFKEGEIDRLIYGESAREDVVPELPETPVTQTGDLWLLGPHRVLCGTPPAQRPCRGFWVSASRF